MLEVRRHKEVVGDGLSTSATVRHNFGTQDYLVNVYTPEYDEVPISELTLTKHLNYVVIEHAWVELLPDGAKRCDAPIPKDGWRVVVTA